MIKFTEFQENFEIIEINFDFKYPTKLMMMIYEKCKHISTEDLNKAVAKILAMNAEGWSKVCGFGKKSPPLAEWINLFAGIKEPSPELKAALEVARILDFASYYYGNSVWFDNPTTNACVETYGGIGKIAWAIDKTNENKDDAKWIAKNLKDIWLQCFDGKVEKTTPCIGRAKPRIMHKGEWIEPEIEISFVGDKTKYLAIENKPQTEFKALPLPILKRI